MPPYYSKRMSALAASNSGRADDDDDDRASEGWSEVASNDGEQSWSEVASTASTESTGHLRAEDALSFQGDDDYDDDGGGGGSGGVGEDAAEGMPRAAGGGGGAAGGGGGGGGRHADVDYYSTSDSESRTTNTEDAFDSLSITSELSQDTSLDDCNGGAGGASGGGGAAAASTGGLTSAAVAALDAPPRPYIAPGRFLARANNLYSDQQQDDTSSTNSAALPRPNLKQVGKRKQRRRENDQLLSVPRHLLPRSRESGATKLFPIPESGSHFGTAVLGSVARETEVRHRFSAGYNTLSRRAERRAERRARRVGRSTGGGAREEREGEGHPPRSRDSSVESVR